MSHTPTPWKLKKSSAIAFRIKCDEHGVVGDFLGHEANAAFIVEACNAHERLKRERDALKRALEIIRAEAGKPWSDNNTLLSEGAKYEADKALALCEEGGK